MTNVSVRIEETTWEFLGKHLPKSGVFFFDIVRVNIYPNFAYFINYRGGF